METFPTTDFEEAANAAITNVRNSLEKWNSNFKNKRNSLKPPKRVQIAAPAFQWAQSLNNVYLNVKYSPKLDSPGYLEVKNEMVNLTNHSFALSADIERVISSTLVTCANKKCLIGGQHIEI